MAEQESVESLLDRIRELDEAATKGPWTDGSSGVTFRVKAKNHGGGPKRVTICQKVPEIAGTSKADAKRNFRFIRESRTLLLRAAEAIAAEKKKREEIETEFSESLGLMRKREQPWIELWRTEKPGERELQLPDHGQILAWIVERADRIRNAARRYKAGHPCSDKSGTSCPALAELDAAIGKE